MRQIIKIRVMQLRETDRTTFYVVAETDEGLTRSVDHFRTGGLSIKEARDRALISAADWGDFLQIEPEPFIMGGVRYEPSMKLEIYTTMRELKDDEG